MSVIIDEFEIVPPSKPADPASPKPEPQKASGDHGFDAANALRLMDHRAARCMRLFAD